MENKMLLIIPEMPQQQTEAPPENEPFWDLAVRRASDAGKFILRNNPLAYASDLYDLYDEWRKSDFRLETRAEALKKGMCFPIGHPKESWVYAPHPVIDKHYLTLADFHRRVLEHKFAEIMQLLNALGARHIKVEYLKGWRRDSAQHVEATTPGESVSISSSTNQSKDDSIIMECKYEGHTAPYLPENLRWYESEPMWQRIAEDRLHGGLQTFDLQLNYNDDFGVTAKVASQAKSCNASIGGSFEEYTSTTWSIRGEFA